MVKLSPKAALSVGEDSHERPKRVRDQEIERKEIIIGASKDNQGVTPNIDPHINKKNKIQMQAELHERDNVNKQNEQAEQANEDQQMDMNTALRYINEGKLAETNEGEPVENEAMEESEEQDDEERERIEKEKAREKEREARERMGKMKLDEEISIIATLKNQEGKILHHNGESIVGLNRFKPTAEGGVEIMRNFEFVPIDNLSEIGGLFHSLVKEDDTNEIPLQGDMEEWQTHPMLQNHPDLVHEDGSINHEAAINETNANIDQANMSVNTIPATPNSDDLLNIISIPISQWPKPNGKTEGDDKTVNPVINVQGESLYEINKSIARELPDILIDSDDDLFESEDESDQHENEANYEEQEDEFDTVMAMTRGAIKRRREEDDNEPEEFVSEPLDEWKRMKQAQLRDEDIRSFIKLVNAGRPPLEYEVRAESRTANHLYRIFDSLLVISGHLFKRTLDDANDIKNLLIIPESQSYGLVKRFHEKLCHTDLWRIEKIVTTRFYVYDIKDVSRMVKAQCENCILAKSPTTPAHRHIRTYSSTPGFAASCDIVELPEVNGWRYLLTCVDLASGFVMARKQKTKSAIETAKSFADIQWAHGVLFRLVVVDPGTEFLNQRFREVCESNSTEIIINTVLDKNACGLVESSHARLLNLMRKSLEKDSDWPAGFKRAQFSLNASLFRYGTNPGCIASPLTVFAAKSFEGVAWIENEMERNLIERNVSVRQLMNNIAKERLIYVASLSANVLSRKMFFPAQKVLVWREFCLKKRLQNSGLVKMKLQKFWSIAEVINMVNSDIYEVQILENNEIRRVHRRQLRDLPVDFDPSKVTTSQ